MYNNVTLIGRTGSDLEMFYFDSGGCIGKTTLATTSSYTNKQTNEKVVNTTWHNLVFRNGSAESVSKYAKKGSLIQVNGMIDNRSYDDKDGVKRYITEIKVLSFLFIKTVNNENSNNTDSNQAPPPAPAPNSNNIPNNLGNNQEEDQDDLPF